MSLGCGRIPGETFLCRQAFCVRDRSTPSGYEVAVAVTRSHPGNLYAHGKVDPYGRRTKIPNWPPNRKVRSDT